MRSLGWALLALVLVVAALWRFGGGETSAIDARLRAYAADVAAGELELAYARHLTPQLQQRTAELLFRTGQMRNVDDWGPVEALVREPGEPERRGSRARVIVQRRSSSHTVRGAVELVRSGDDWRIDGMWWWPRQGPAVPRML